MGGVAKGIASVAAPIPMLGTGQSSVPGWLGLTSPDQTGDINQVDPRLAALHQQQVGNAKDYRENIGDYRQQQSGILKDQARNSLAQSIKDSNASENSRGLLYGGHRDAQEQGLRAKSASDVNSGIANINAATENNAQQLESQAIGSGVTLQNMNQNRNDQMYNTALNQQKNKAGVVNGLLNSAGSLAGLG